MNETSAGVTAGVTAEVESVGALEGPVHAVADRVSLCGVPLYGKGGVPIAATTERDEEVSCDDCNQEIIELRYG